MVPFFVLSRGFERMRDALMRLLEPPIEALGFELVDVEFVREGQGGVLRIFIDHRAENSGVGVTVDDCAREPRGEPGARDPGSDQGALHAGSLFAGIRSDLADSRALRAVYRRTHLRRAEGGPGWQAALCRRVEVGCGRRDCSGSGRQGAQPAARKNSEGEIAAGVTRSLKGP